MAGLRSPSRYCLLHKVQIRCYSAPVGRQIPESKLKYVPKSGTYPKGFRVSGTHVGVKPNNKTYPDLALITSEKPCSAAAVFTKHAFEAAPVTISKQVLEKNGSNMKSIIINSGNANSKTGTAGFEAARSMAAALDGVQPNATPNSSLVMSTGVIGVPLPVEKILNGVPNGISKLGSSHADWLDTAWSICTTDTFPKLLSTTFTLPSSPDVTCSMAGMTKGAGMIHPNMATLLGIVCTDADIAQDPLQAMLRSAAESSFNAISIDGCTSTNDTLAMLANGAAGGNPLRTRHTSDYKVMREVLTEFLQKLSHLVVRDGEGATKFVRVRVINSTSHRDAKAVASKIACNPLVKTALYGKDANWGRILGAIDYTETSDVSERASVSFVPTDGSETLELVVNGEPQGFEEARATEILTQQDLEILVDLGGGREGTGNEEASYWFCDFSHEYVTINADYRT